MNAESAQPRNRSNVTRPFPIVWVWSGDETGVSPDVANVSLYSLETQL